MSTAEPAATILVVEDDAPTRTFLADNLTADGYELLVAETAREALRLLAALGEVALVEGEAQLAVLEDEVLSGVVVAAAGRIHGGARPRRRPSSVGSSAS